MILVVNNDIFFSLWKNTAFNKDSEYIERKLCVITPSRLLQCSMFFLKSVDFIVFFFKLLYNIGNNLIRNNI